MKLKPVIILILTLTLGFVLGAITNGYFLKSKIHAYQNMKSVEGFKNKFMEILAPDQKQKEVIEPIIEKYAKKNKDFHCEYFRQIAERMDSFEIELIPYLTTQQLESMDKFKQHRKSVNENNKKE
jgi:hypothetical protein